MKESKSHNTEILLQVIVPVIPDMFLKCTYVCSLCLGKLEFGSLYQNKSANNALYFHDLSVLKIPWNTWS